MTLSPNIIPIKDVRQFETERYLIRQQQNHLRTMYTNTCWKLTGEHYEDWARDGLMMTGRYLNVLHGDMRDKIVEATDD
jgi:hypothetical protein